jgi:hypothetical protein
MKKHSRPAASSADEATQWQNDQLDPSNWLRIPEFGVMPLDVGFTGFAFPIVHPNAPMREVRENVRDLVRLARKLIVRECPTRKDQLSTFTEWLDGEQLTSKRYAAATYAIVMQQLEHALKQTEPLARIEIPGERGIEEFFADAMQALSLAAVMLAEWSAKDPKAPPPPLAISPEEAMSVMKAVMSEIGKRGRQKSLLETNAMKEEVRRWCEANRSSFKSLNALRDAAVAARLNVAAPNTIRGWLTEWAVVWRASGIWPSGDR